MNNKDPNEISQQPLDEGSDPTQKINAIEPTEVGLESTVDSESGSFTNESKDVETTQEIQQGADIKSNIGDDSPPKPFPTPDYPLSGAGNGPPSPKTKKPLSPLVKVAAIAAVVSLILGGTAGAVVAKLTSKTTAAPTTTFARNNSVIATPTDIQGILSKVEPAVVDIQTQGITNQGGFFGGSSTFQAAGTGMIITSNGEVLTNNHVIANATSIKVQLFNQTTLYNATVVGADPTHDVAVIKIQGVSNLPTVTFGKSSALQVGDSVVAVGNALALQGLPTVTQGIVSGLHRSISTGTTTLTDLIQTDAPINPGNSGGPLVNSSGQVIGMNTAIISGTGNEPAQNIGFAEAIDSVLPIVHQIEAHPNTSNGTITSGKAFLGVGIQNLTPSIAAQLGLATNLSGVLVVDVVPGSPANSAGITAGSVITSVDGKKVTSASQLVAAIQKKAPGDRVTISWTNSNGSGSAVVTLGSAPSA